MALMALVVYWMLLALMLMVQVVVLAVGHTDDVRCTKLSALRLAYSHTPVRIPKKRTCAPPFAGRIVVIHNPPVASRYCLPSTLHLLSRHVETVIFQHCRNFLPDVLFLHLWVSELV